MTTKIALVTGAARGIGRAIALRLAKDGLDVAVNDLPNTPELDDVVREIENKGRRSLAVPADVSLEEDVEKIIQQVVQKLGSLDVVSFSDGYHSGNMLYLTFKRTIRWSRTQG
jgi:NAD(P)-dependent dehydrogenase (short-subunit alcohol dehydrogenase family)